MKKIISGILTAAIISSTCTIFAAADNSAPYIKADKTNFVVGTTGTLTPVGASGVTYSSDCEEVAMVSDDGTIIAVGVGTTVITPSVGEPISITVHAKAPDDAESNIVDDINEGKLIYSYDKRWDKMADLRTGNTKLWGYCSDGGTTMYEDAVFQSSGSENALCGFVYKLDGELDSLTAYTRTYDELETIKPRTQIAYLVDDTVTFNGSTTWSDVENLTQYAVEKGVVADWSAPAALNPMWTVISEENLSWEWNCDEVGKAPYLCSIKANNIPADAKYALIVIKNDTKAVESGSRYRYKGVKFNYKKKLVAGEFIDNKAVLTFNGDIGSTDGMVVKKNGVAIMNADVTYDKDAFTAVVDGDFSNADYVEIETSCGNYVGTVPGIPLNVEYDRLYFTVPKTIYVAGTSGKIDLIVEKDGEKKRNLLPTTYISDNNDVVKVDNNGNITAVAAGTAHIMPTVTGVEESFDTITITVHESSPGKVDSNIMEDIAAGTLVLDYERGEEMSKKRKGTKLWAYAADDPFVTDEASASVFSALNSDASYMSFVYKLDGELDSLIAHTFGYGDVSNYAKVRTDIGYLTDETKTFADFGGGGSYTWDSADLTWFAAGGGAVKKVEAPIALNSEVWTKVGNDAVTWVTDENARTADVSTSAIPSDAKYVIVLLKSGTLTDGTAKLTDQYFRYRGITLNYKTKLVGNEMDSDNKITLTFNGDINSMGSIVVKKNGAVVENPHITYDASSYTAVIDGGFAEGDEIEIESPYGNCEMLITDNREQICEAAIYSDNGEKIDEMFVGMTEVKAVIKAKNVTSAKALTAYVSVYDNDGNLVGVMTEPATVTDSMAQAECTLTGIEVEPNYSLKVFLWDSEMKPVANYKNVTTYWRTEDF